jgi:hypothetical protein
MTPDDLPPDVMPLVFGIEEESSMFNVDEVPFP